MTAITHDTNPTHRTNKVTVIAASTIGTIFEWYDFYLYGSLAAVLGNNFFATTTPTQAYIFGLLTFASGFLVRPFGALVFGRLGDKVGRKYTFLATILIMGFATFAVGLLPTYETAGLLAPILLIALRMLQGLAIGGEYGGAAVYIAEHAPDGERGGFTSWLQTAFVLGLCLSLIVILACRSIMTPEDFDAWGWRLPFLSSIILLAISTWIRFKLHESPVFTEMKTAGKISKAPVSESFGNWKNLKIVLIVLFGLMAGQTVITNAGPIYSALFLMNTLKVDPVLANMLSVAGLLIGAPFYVIFGYVSDRIGRKPLILTALMLATLTLFPVYHALTHYANPALESAQAKSPVVVVSNPNNCSIQFNPVGTSKFTSACDVAKTALVRRGIPYSNQSTTDASTAIKVGTVSITSYDGSAHDAKDAGSRFENELNTALASAGYPAKADSSQVNNGMIIALIVYLQFLSAMVFGPMAAALVEVFPARIRYTSLSFPYHIGNGWIGGLLPASVVAIQAATGSIFDGLWYPVCITAVGFVICLLLVPETKDQKLDT